MPTPATESYWRSRCAASLERSRKRRERARRERRRRLRARGGGLSAAIVALAVGIVGAGAAVGQSGGSNATYSQGLLAKGSRGPAVVQVQRALGMRGTGYFGPVTQAAVRRFQRRRGLLVDGVVGPQTRAALALAPPAAAGASSPSTAGAQAVRGAPGGLQQIAQCESGGNPRAVGGGGLYRGKYQFTRATWQAVGGSGDPAAAPEAEQDQRAATLYSSSGTASWPSCG